MKIVVLLLALIAGALFVSPASAQATRTWVSGVGDDVNPCSRTAPCKTFAGAISRTAVNGEINCIDPGGFGAVTITKSITIDCTNTMGSILAAGTNGVIVNFNSFAVTDVRKTVRLRGLSINGANTGLNGIRILGAAAAAGSTVMIEDVVIDGFFGTGGAGIVDERTGGGELSVYNTSIRDNGGTCIALLTGTVRKDAILDNVSAVNCNNGMTVANFVRAMITHSTFSLNAAAGISVEAGSDVSIDYGVISNNNVGMANAAAARLANTQVSYNATGFTGTAVQSHGHNRLVGNTAVGVFPTTIGSQSESFGER
jgi:hypothetical protein